MIPGIMASQSLEASEGSGSALPAGDLLAHIDFVDGEYEVLGVSYDPEDILAGSFDDADISILGLRADYTTEDAPLAFGPLLEAVQQYFVGGLTFVFEVERVNGGALEKINGYAAYFYEKTDLNDFDSNTILMDAFAHPSTNDVTLNDIIQVATTPLTNSNIVLNARNKFKYTLSRDAGGGTREYACSANAHSANTDTVSYDLSYFDLQLISLFGVEPYGFHFDGECYVRGLAIYGAVAPGDLPALTPVFGLSTDNGLGTTAVFADVLFLSDFDGVDGATSATDDSTVANTIVFHASAQVDTAQSKFGGASLLLDGSGHVTIEQTTDNEFQFGTGPFCVEAWVRLSALPSGGNIGVIMGQFSVSTDDEESWGLSVTDAGGLQVRWSVDGNSAFTRTTGAGEVTTGVWYHIALERDEARHLRLYVDGAVLLSEVLHADIFDSTRDIGIGASTEGDFRLTGWIDEPRITKGASQYSSEAGFTPPAAPFPRS